MNSTEPVLFESLLKVSSKTYVKITVRLLEYVYVEESHSLSVLLRQGYVRPLC